MYGENRFTYKSIITVEQFTERNKIITYLVNVCKIHIAR